MDKEANDFNCKEDIGCPLLNRNISWMYCNRVLNEVYYFMPNNAPIKETFTDDEKEEAGKICKQCFESGYPLLDQEQKQFLLDNASLVNESATNDLFSNKDAMLKICAYVYTEELHREKNKDPNLDYVRLSLAEQITEIIL